MMARRVIMRAIGNFLWFILGGVCMGLAWWLIGLLAYITILGIPWGRSCFVIGKFTFFPFGREAISRKELRNKDDIGTGGLGVIGNIIWFIFAGIWLAIGHVCSAVLNFVTIIGIPFGIQHLKLAGIALAPIGKTIVTKEIAAAARKVNTEATISSLRLSFYILLSLSLYNCDQGESTFFPLINPRLQIYNIAELPPADRYYSFSFIDLNQGWVLCDSNIIYRTMDGGKNWEEQFCTADSQLLRIRFASADRGWILARGSVYRSDNGGEDWHIIYTDSNITQFEKIAFVNEQTGWITYSSKGNLLHTNDAGNSWTVQETGLPLHVLGFSFLNCNIGYAIDALSSVASTSDGGNNWSMKTKVLWPYTIFFLNEQTGFIGNFTYLSSTRMAANIFRTDDYGNSWRTLEIPFCQLVGKIRFIDTFHGMAATSDEETGQIIYTCNGGETWKIYNELDSYPMDIITVDNNYIFIFCQSGKIYKLYFD